MAVSDKEIQYIAGRLRNSFGAAEGTLLPPPLKGQFRVPFVTNFRLANTESFVGGTQFTLTFNAPESNQSVIDHFNIFVTGLNGDFTTLVGPSTCSTSPATVRITTPTAQTLIFTVQTVLKSGLVSDLDSAPTVTGTTIAAQINSNTDIPDGSINIDKFAPSTPGAVNAYDSSGDPTLISPVASGRILTSAGTTNPPTYQTKISLDLVLGNSALTTADSIVYVSSSGTVTQLVPSTSGFVLQTNGAGVAPSWVANTSADAVQGAANLTDVGAVPYVSSSGTLDDDSANFFWDATNHRLGIGTNVPSLPLDVRGDIGIGTAGKTLKIKEGSNAAMGLSTLVTGTVTVATTAIAANSRVMLTPQDAGSTLAPGTVYISARTAGTSFVITSTDITDDRTVAWFLLSPFQGAN